jgi:ABC-type cobalamin transport system ATPase subunit
MVVLIGRLFLIQCVQRESLLRKLRPTQAKSQIKRGKILDRHADTIYVFEQGRIAECGSHMELLVQDGLYAELFNMQAEGFLLAGQPVSGD